MKPASRCLLLLVLVAASLAQTTYQKPPKEILDVLNSPSPPVASVSPDGSHLLLLQPLRYPPIAEVARPMLRLAGIRIDPATNGPHLAPYYMRIAIKGTAGGPERAVVLPPGAHPGMPQWSPDGKRFALANTTSAGIELWIGETATASVRRIPGVRLNAVTGSAFQWVSSTRLLALLVPALRGRPPAAPAAPKGPNIQETLGKAAPAATFQDLLASPHHEDLFDYYATAQLAFVEVPGGRVAPVGKPAIFQSAQPAPDGKHILVARLHRPYSYLHPYSMFPKEVEVWDSAGKPVYKLASLPLEDKVPIEGVPVGPRNYQWRPAGPATLVWVEALDGGDPKNTVPHRDRVLTLAYPFQGAPAELARVEHRFRGLSWTETGSTALLADYDRKRRWVRTFLLDAANPSAEPRLVWSLSSQDRYKDPGDPVVKTLPNGRRAIRQDGEWIFLTGSGASPEGDRPFLDRFSLKTLRAERLFRCDEQSYETVVALASADGSRFITRREDPVSPPNYYLRSASGTEPAALTAYRDPAPQLRRVRKQLVTYQRPDGVALSFTLYLPPDYRGGTRLPTVMWAYPLEYADAGTAGQVTGSVRRFTTIDGMSHLFFLLRGYAILDGAAMPVVGDPDTVNNTYIEQIVADAKAAIDKAAAMGVTDPTRVGVGGHSYGAFMTANLLANSDLFQAGIARSGAHNRTLTPFGFQSERRTLWEAPEVYLRMSPFMRADKIKAPILLIHGEADNNSGTFPIQSERMYQAVRGNGGIARLVMLPHESHGYTARESIEHTLYEMISWFDRYVKKEAR